MTKYPLYDKAKILVRKEYEDAFEIVKESFYHRSFANWKIKHTFQVSGAGNGILAHEPYFQNRSDEFIDICRTAILLHDVYRFREVTGWFQDDTKIDHSLMGAELLSQTKDFNDILITLPIKHHGNMIEKLYEDEAYQTLNDDLKDKMGGDFKNKYFISNSVEGVDEKKADKIEKRVMTEATRRQAIVKRYKDKVSKEEYEYNYELNREKAPVVRRINWYYIITTSILIGIGLGLFLLFLLDFIGF